MKKVPQERIPALPVSLVQHQITAVPNWRINAPQGSAACVPWTHSALLCWEQWGSSRYYFYQFWIRYSVTFSCYSMYLWVHWCVTLQYHYCLGARADLCNKRVSLGFQHLSDLSHSPTAAKNMSFNAVNTGHALCVFSLLIVSSGLWNSSPFWNHKTLTVRQRRIQSV